MKEAEHQPAGVTGERDARLDRLLAACSQLAVALAERWAVLGEAPGDPHQSVAVLGQAGAADAAAFRHGARLVGRRRQTGGGIEVLGRGKAPDRERERGEGRGTDRATPGSVVSTWPAV